MVARLSIKCTPILVLSGVKPWNSQDLIMIKTSYIFFYTFTSNLIGIQNNSRCSPWQLSQSVSALNLQDSPLADAALRQPSACRHWPSLTIPPSLLIVRAADLHDWPLVRLKSTMMTSCSVGAAVSGAERPHLWTLPQHRKKMYKSLGRKWMESYEKKKEKTEEGLMGNNDRWWLVAKALQLSHHSSANTNAHLLLR